MYPPDELTKETAWFRDAQLLPFHWPGLVSTHESLFPNANTLPEAKWKIIVIIFD